FYAALSGPNPYGEPVFPEWVDVPDMPWKTVPQKGFLMGKVKGVRGPADGVKVKLRGPKGVLRETRTDGNGFFGFSDLSPGTYVIQVDKRVAAAKVTKVKAGNVAEVNMQLIK
ncbi:MAG: carboxypeptidase regulatory-like domain-containing protein, partial [Planifilum fimeticola]